MDIELTHKRVDQLTMESLTKGQIEQEQPITVNIGSTVYAHDQDKKMVRINYPVIVTVKDNVTISIGYNFYFKLSESVADDFHKSEVARKTAPALAYPYIKSYIESVLLLSGYRDFSIPFLDFNKDPFDFFE
ncbi:hypothetical protein ABN357_19530 [Providencia rettgeri]|uniref:hypothetical protein n=1 Tax=Morganellaceae TaxID=1903414 RepID=UPI001F4DA83A|nr:hypothetical protein [Moellerella wisconsensis]ELY3856773.1 hypothetical protein [Providencia rettgeri]UNH43274.1 hypothetical protein MNY66_04655 [Moellerella wisconsensis]